MPAPFFATDALARAAAAHAISAGHDRDPSFTDAWRQFFYIPFQHSEDLVDQDRCYALTAERLSGDSDALDYARKHREIIARFGRFPHRNAALGRDSTPEEIAFLAQHGTPF